jgi:MFS family permease
VYLFGAERRVVSAADATAAESRRVPKNVLALGTVSLVTDVSSEMVTAILPIYLMFGLGLSALGFGFVDGIYNGATIFVSLLGGHVADRTQQRKSVAQVGYTLSALCKLGLLAAGSSIGLITAVIGLDRVGKGLRTAPRDALISLSSSKETLGRSFGVHRAMDTAGAVIGPFVAFLVLRLAPARYDAVFVVSFCFATAGLVILALFVRNVRGEVAHRRDVSMRAAAELLRESAFRRICLLSTMLAMVTMSDAFIYLVLQRRLDVAIAFFPLFPIGTSLVYLLLAVPLGRLADRVGRWRVFLAGNVVMAVLYQLLLSNVGGVPLLVSVLSCLGIYYAATNGVLMALAAPELPVALRTSGLALVQTGTALGGFASSVVFGALWSVSGPTFAVEVFAVAMVVALLIALATGIRAGGFRARATA